jgi:creatinine amidohydrolase/Fe(II)-dependent formamide hydrolase-like protein
LTSIVWGYPRSAAEASFVVETHPELVQRDTLSRGYVGEVDGEPLQREGLDAVSDNGVLSDRKKTSSATGRTTVHNTVRYLADAIEGEME